MLAFLAPLFLLAVAPVAALPAVDAPVATPAVAPAATPASTEAAAPTPALPAWYSRLSPPTPGSFAPIRSYNASYRITWSGLEAAHVDAQVKSPADGAQIRTNVKAASTGAARTLFKLDATHLSVVDRHTLRPIFLEQTERGSRKNVSARVDFAPDGATRRYHDLARPNDSDTDVPGKPRRFPYPGLFDMEGVLLYLRSQPLAAGDEKTLLFMTAGSPYVATIKVLGRSRVHLKAGDYPAIECSLKLEKVGKGGVLEPRKGFKSARAWFSDDADRLLIKAQSDIFIGSVSLELEKVSFPAASH